MERYHKIPRKGGGGVDDFNTKVAYSSNRQSGIEHFITDFPKCMNFMKVSVSEQTNSPFPNDRI